MLMPWIIDRVTSDIKSGRLTIIDESEIKHELMRRKEAIRAAYRGH